MIFIPSLPVLWAACPLGEEVAPPAGARIERAEACGLPTQPVTGSCQAPALLRAPSTALGATAGDAKHWRSCHRIAGFRPFEAPERLGEGGRNSDITSKL